MGSNNENTLYTGNFFRSLFLAPKRKGLIALWSEPSQQVCRKMPLSNGKHLLPNDPPKKGRLFEIRRLKGRTSFRPCTRVLTKVPFLPMERRNICLSRPPIWAKFSFQIFLKLLKPAACLSAKERYLDDCLILGSSVEESRANTR